MPNKNSVCRINGNIVEIRFKGETVLTIRVGKDDKLNLEYKVEVADDASKGVLKVERLALNWRFDHQLTGNEYTGSRHEPE